MAPRSLRRPARASKLAAACAAGALVAFGCAGCGGDGPADATTTTAVPTTTTSTTKFHVHSPCTVENDVAQCVEYLNEQYMGYDPANETSPLGVAIRGQPRFNHPWFFCTQQCFRGQPDCYVAASLLNHKVMLHEKVNTVAMPLNYAVGIVFQPTAVERHLTKCAWQFDGAAFNRMNGGCGPGATELNCSKPGTAFGNTCPSSGKIADVQDECPDIERESCQMKPGSRYPTTCFWKGPAFYSSATPGVYPNLTEGHSEIRDMMRQRMGDQDGKTGDGIPLVQYWNELTMDGKILDVMLKNNVPAAIAAVMYQSGNAQAKGWAEQYNKALKEDYGQEVHLVELDFNKQIGQDGKGPFLAPAGSVRVVV